MLIARRRSSSLKDQGQPAYTMVMKGFPGEHVDELKDVQNIEISVVQAEVKTFMETLNAKELILYWVPYQFDFVDASNFLSIWRSDGRHAWKNEKFEELLRQADSEFDDPEKRDDLFLQAERILVEDCPAVFVFHPTFWQLWKPFLVGEDLTPNEAGFRAWVYLNNRIYRTWYINNTFKPA